VDRAVAIRHCLAAFPREPIVVTLGTTSREVIAQVPEAANHLHLLDSMGLAPAVAAGVALGIAARSRTKVVAMEGDGGALMGFTVFATLAHLQIDNLVLLILDDGVYAATGGQATGSASVDIAAVARACGLVAEDANNERELSDALDRARTATRAFVLRVHVDAQIAKRPLYLPDPPLLAQRFRAYLASLV
jgi:sulfopyruvate decarboxylase subunit beta